MFHKLYYFIFFIFAINLNVYNNYYKNIENLITNLFILLAEIFNILIENTIMYKRKNSVLMENGQKYYQLRTTVKV